MRIREEQLKLAITQETQKIFDLILNDILESREDVFNRREYYGRKYQKYSDRMRDVNVGIGVTEDGANPCVQIYIADKYTKTRLLLKHSKNCQEIVEQELIQKTREQKMKEETKKEFATIELPLFEPAYSHLTNAQLYEEVKKIAKESLGVEVAYLKEDTYPENGMRIFKIFV